MIDIFNLVTPSAEWWYTAIHGMRNPFKSGDKSDSGICRDSEEADELCYSGCPYVDHWEDEAPYSYPVCYYSTWDDGPVFVLGEKDKKLFLNLCKAGDPSHRKVLRQLPVIMDITAPLYWWKQMDQYKIGTVTNSESTMHTLTKQPFSLLDFNIPDRDERKFYENKENGIPVDGGFQMPILFYIDLLNTYRDKFLDTGDKRYWNAINELLPLSYKQKRTWSANYEVLVTIIKQRRHHKLSEWDEFIDHLLERVPYLKDICEALEI